MQGRRERPIAKAIGATEDAAARSVIAGQKQACVTGRGTRRMTSKHELRRELIAARRAIRPDEVAAKSAAITRTLFESVDWAAIRTLHVYDAVGAWREVRTDELVARVRATWPHVEITVPTAAKDQPVPTTPFDLIVVPVLGFDDDRYRLGLGGGYYDRFLAGQAQALKIGLAYECAFVSGGVPREAHDIRLDRIITESG